MISPGASKLTRLVLALATVIAALVVALAWPGGARADFTTTEGTAFSGTLGTIEASCPVNSKTRVPTCSNALPTAAIDWGDGDSADDSGQLVYVSKDGTTSCAQEGGPDKPGVCGYELSASHTYVSPGTYSGSVFVDSPSGSGNRELPFTATVTDAPISLSNAKLTRSGKSATITATLTDGDAEATGCGYTATIDWGDGTGPQNATTTPGCIIQVARAHRDAATSTEAAGATFTVTGTHTYAAGEPTSSQAVISVVDFGGAQATLPVTIPLPPDQTSTNTRPASAISDTSATLNGDIDALGGHVASCKFEWGTTKAYGNTVPCSKITQDKQAVSAALTGLSPSTSYHYRLDFKTEVGSVTGDDESFSTLATPASGAPVVTTLGADPATTTATIFGGADPFAGTLTDCHFEWGTTTHYGNVAPCSPSTVPGNVFTDVKAVLTGLSPDTAYHYRLVAANAGAPATDGADATFTTKPDCNVTAQFGYVDATGCLSHPSALWFSTPGSTVSLNGLTLVPDGNASITLDPTTGRISSDGPVSVQASGAGVGTVDIYDATFNWTEPDPGGATTVSLGAIGTVDPHATIADIPLNGDLALAFTNKDGAQITGSATLPFGPLSFLSSVIGNGTMTLDTLPGTGLISNQLQITSNGLQLAGFGVTGLKVTYDPNNDAWSGGATIKLPTPKPLSIAASLAFQHGQFQKFSGAADGLNIPLFAGVELQRISVVIGVNPTTIGGGLGVSFGPSLPDPEEPLKPARQPSLVRVDGDFVYQGATATADGFINVDGSLTLASFKIADAYFDYRFPSDFVQFGGQLGVGLPNPDAKDPTKQPVYLSAGLKGALQGSHFDIDVYANAALNFAHLGSLGVELLVSDKGIVACAHLLFGWSPGVGYTWGGGLNLMSHGCDVGQYETLDINQPTASALIRQRVIHLSGGGSLLAIKGAGHGAPKLALHGPHGAVIKVPLDSVKPIERPDYMVLQDPANGTVWVGLKHGAGTWRIAAENARTSIQSIKVAPLLPQPKVSAHVTGKGRKRALHFSVRKIPGQRVVFWEKGKDVGHIIGRTTKAHGTLHFRLAPGHSHARTIEAQVISYGMPRTDVTVAHFTAPPPPKAGKVKRLTVAAVKGGGLRIGWQAAANAAQYRVDVAANGGQITRLVGAKTRSVVIKSAVPITAAQVTVTAELAGGVPGPGATATFPAPHHKVKKSRPKHKTRKHAPPSPR